MKLKIKFGKFEERLARRIARYLRTSKTRTPKKWEVILTDNKNDPPTTWKKDGGFIAHRGATDRRAFKNLVALGFVEHSQNGHCWLTKAGAKKLRLVGSFR